MTKNNFRFRYVLLLVIMVCYTMQYVDRGATTTLMPWISADVGLNERQIGLGFAIMLLFYGPSQLVTGWICDRIGSRKVLIFSIISWSILTGYLSRIRTPDQWYIRMALFGILIGTEFVPSARVIVRWFPSRIRARAQSFLSWAWIVTPAWAPILATALYQGFGYDWRMVFVVLGIAGIIPFCLILAAVHDRPEICKYATPEEVMEAYEDEIKRGLITEQDIRSGNACAIAAKAKSGGLPFREMFNTRGFIPLCLVYVAAQLAFWGVMTWSAQYMSQVHGFKVMKMGVWASVYFAGGAIGSFLSGWVSDKILGGRRKPMILMCFTCMIPFILILANIEKGVSPWVLLLTLTGAGFFSNMVWGPALTLPADMFSVEVYGKAIGFINCCAYMVASASPYIMGMLIHTHPETKITSYFWAWLWVACTASIGVVASCFLKEKPRMVSNFQS